MRISEQFARGSGGREIAKIEDLGIFGGLAMSGEFGSVSNRFQNMRDVFAGKF